MLRRPMSNIDSQSSYLSVTVSWLPNKAFHRLSLVSHLINRPWIQNIAPSLLPRATQHHMCDNV